MRQLSSGDFVAARYPVALAADEIQLWFMPGIAAGEARARVAAVLSAYLDCRPDDLSFGRGEFGKPHLKSPAPVEFNVSHSRRGLLLALSREQALGVDIETERRSRPALDLARRFFHPDEAAALARLDPAIRQAAFLSLWTCKEAVVKALGRGIGFGLARVAFGLDAAGGPTGLNVIDASAGSPAEWQIVTMRLPAECTGALAWRGPLRPVRAFVAEEPPVSRRKMLPDRSNPV